MSGIIILSILFALLASYHLTFVGDLVKRILPWGGDASLKESRITRSSTNNLPPKATCYRIQGIPITVTKEELRRQLTQPLSTVDDQDSLDLHLTLARSYSEYQIATFVSTSSIPRNLKYSVDVNFNGITPLFEPKDAEIDIIAVHGLGSHAIGGFKSKGTSHVWLRDSLPHDIPNSRILLYGHDSSIMNKDHKISMSGLGKTFLNAYKTFRKDTKTTQRPIIFLGHSLGGLLIKEALCLVFDGKRDAQNRDFCLSSYGLVFFGVPNLGLKHENLKIITREHLNHQLIHDLLIDKESEATPYLQSLQEKFISCHRQQDPPMKIISFYEEKKTLTVAIDNNTGKMGRTGESCFMVTKESACRIGLEDDTHSQHPLPFDHSDLVKFAHGWDASYRIVQDKLRDLVQKGLDYVPKRFQSDVELSAEQKRHWDDLNVPDYRAFYENKEKLPKPVEGSLQWLVSKDSQRPRGEDSLQYEDFETWRDSSTPSSLLVLGPPGLGKSVLTNFVVNHIQQFVENQCNNKVIFFFCNIKDDNARTASAVLRALIVQLCTDKRYFQKLPNRFQARGDSKAFHSAAFDELWRTFDDLVQSGQHDRIFCIIDGLDVYESPGMEELVTKLGEVAGRRPIWLFFTSRPDGPVANFLSGTKRNLRQPNHDIEVFITKQLELLPKNFNKYYPDIRQGILSRAGGTFLWVHIILREIRRVKFPTPRKIKEVIEKTPQELDELYAGLFRAISRGKHATAILAWVTFAKWPLSFEDLEVAVAVMVTNSDNWADCLEEKVSLDADLIKERLGTLIDVIDGELFFIHQSVLDFLRSRPHIWNEGDLELQLPRPNIELGRTCMRYMSFGDLDLREDYDSRQLRRDYSYKEGANFFRYASRCWYEHIESINDVKDDIDILKRAFQGLTNDLLRQRFSNSMLGHHSTIFDFCIEFDIGWLASALADPTIPELSYNFSKYDLARAASKAPNVLNHLLQSGFEITPQVVMAAAGEASGEEALKVLLEMGGDDVQITPEVVLAAAGNDYGEQVLELLLERRGEEIQITPEVVTEAARDRLHGGEMLKMLLEKRGDKIQITPEAVLAAAEGTISKSLKVLLEKRGDEIQITPEVLVAAAGSFSDNLELLLEKRGNEFQITSEVVIAAAGGHYKNLKLLLEKRGNEFQITPEVVIAAAGCHYENLKLLLEKRGNEFQITPEVVIAAAGGHYENLKLLLEKRGNEFQIIPEVVIVAAGGYYENLKLLLEKRGNEFQITPEVVIAAAGGHYENLKLLLEKRGNEFQITSEVVIAAAWGYHANLKLLLEKRGDEIQTMLISSNPYKGRKIQEMGPAEILELCIVAHEKGG